MRLYTAEYDANRPTTKQITVPTNSSFGVAVAVDYNGEPVKIKQREITLGGLSATDVYNDNYAIFKLSSDSNAGVESYTVASTTDGMTVKELSVHAEWNKSEAMPKPDISADLSKWEGITITCDSTPSTNPDFPPFGVLFDKDPATLSGARYWAPTYFMVDGYAGGSGVYAMCQQNSKGFTDSYYEIWMNKPDGSGIITGLSSLTIPANCYARCGFGTSTVGASYIHAAMNGTYNERISRKFELLVKKESNGEIDGYGDELIFKNTVELSGVNADDTSFDFVLPVVEK